MYKVFLDSPVLTADNVMPVAWFEGMQLLPQHMQIADRRVDHLVRRTALGANPYFWGVDTMDLDSSALASGRIRLHAVAGQFADGLVFNYRSSDAEPLELDLGSVSGTERPIGIGLCAPADDVTLGGTSRYTQVGGIAVSDRFNPEERAVVVRLRSNLKLAPWKEAERDGACVLRLLEVVKTSHGFALSDYHPPAICMDRASGLFELISAIATLMRERATAFSGSLTRTNGHDGATQQAFAAVVRALPILEGLLGATFCPPYELYRALCHIAGAVAGANGAVPPFFEPYEHADIRASFGPLANFVQSQLLQLSGPPEPDWAELTFDLNGEYFMIEPRGLEPDRPITLGVRLSSARQRELVAAWLQYALICHETDLFRLRNLRVSGIERKPISVARGGQVSESDTLLLFNLGIQDMSPDGRGKGRILVERPPVALAKDVASLCLFVGANHDGGTPT